MNRTDIYVPNRLLGLPVTSWDRLEEVLERFENVWRAGGRPSLDEFLCGEGVERTALLTELVHADLHYRIKAGEKARVEEYFSRYPEMCEKPEVALALIVAEHDLRKQSESGLRPEDYCDRFRQYAEELARCLVASSIDNDAERPIDHKCDPEAPQDIPDEHEIRTTPHVASGPAETGLDSAATKGRCPAGYEMLGELGRGGMGIVYKARQIGLGRIVALKMILAGGHAGPAQLARFRTEAEAIARLQHPNIVQVYDLGEHDGLPFLSLEFCDGGSLRNKLAGNPLPPEQAAELTEVLARATFAAHQANVIHRDLKPANVLLQKDEGGRMKDEKSKDCSDSSFILHLSSFVPKITDFGLAKKLDEAGQTYTGQVMGTPSYMAPEQAEGKKAIGPSADLYSLGAILYEMLTGRPPFRAATEIDTIMQVIADDPVPPSQLNGNIPRDLETVCLKCLRKDPRQRYADCQDLAGDLRRWLDGEPIRARRVHLVERSLKWARRKPFQAAFALSSLLVVALVAFAGWREARDYRLRYERQIETEAFRGEQEKDYHGARQLMTEGKWVEYRSCLLTIDKGLEARDDRSLDELRGRVKESLDAVDRYFRDREQALERFRAFGNLSRNAVLLQMPLVGRHAPDHGDEARTAVKRPLAIYALQSEPLLPVRLVEQLERDRPMLTTTEFDRLIGTCYELLVIWADIEAGDQGENDESKAEARRRGARALAVLQRAALLGQAYKLRTQTYYIRKSRYQALGHDEKEPPVRVDAGAPAGPTCALDWYFLGLESYHRAEQVEEGRRADRYVDGAAWLAQAVQAQPEHFWAHYLQGLCQLRLGRWLESRTTLTTCMNLQPEFPWPLVLRGFAASKQGEHHKSREEALRKKALGQGKPFQESDEIRLVRRAKESAFALARADFDQALARQQLDAQARYVGLVNRGVLNIYQEKWPESIADLMQAIEVNRAAYQAHADLAQALEGAGRHEEALTAIGRAIACASDRPELYGARAQMHLKRKDRAAARADFERALMREPKTSKSRRVAETLVELGRLHLQDGKYPAALAHFDRALTVWPELTLTERFRAEALLRLGQNDAATAALDRYLAATVNPAPETLQARGLLYAENGKLHDAIEMYSAALRLNAKDTKTRRHRAWTFFKMGAYRPALEDFDVCIREQPHSADHLVGRASARVRLHQVREAIADAESAEKEGSLTDRLCYYLCCVYAQAVTQTEFHSDSAPWRQPSHLLARYEEKALLLLERVLEEQPEKDRARFWQQRVEKDPALTALRGEPRYSKLARKYGGDPRVR